MPPVLLLSLGETLKPKGNHSQDEGRRLEAERVSVHHLISGRDRPHFPDEMAMLEPSDPLVNDHMEGDRVIARPCSVPVITGFHCYLQHLDGSSRMNGC